MEMKDFVRSPFPNYDIVVYFGCGVFRRPFLFHYMLSPNVGNFLRVEASTGVPFADAAVSTLFVLFAVYFLGHLWAFASSIFIEKTADLLLGKTSSACILAHRRKNAQNSFDDIADWVKRRWKLALLWQIFLGGVGEEFVTMWTAPGWRSSEEVKDGLPDGRHGRLWRWPSDSFFSVPLL